MVDYLKVEMKVLSNVLAIDYTMQSNSSREKKMITENENEK